MIFIYSNSSLDAICNDEFYISESTNGANVLTRIWNAIKRALGKIKNFFTKSKNPDIEKLENLTPEEEQLKIEPEIDVVKTMKNIDEEIQDSEKRIKELKDQVTKTASKEERKIINKDIKSENSQLRRLKRTVNKRNRKEDKIRQKELKMQRKQEDEEIRHKTRLQYKEIERGVEGTVSKILIVPLVGVGITIFVAKRILKKIKADTDKLNAQESAIKRIINVSQGLSPEGKDVKAAEGELKVMAKITATLNQVLHEVTSKIVTKVSQSAKEVSKKVKDDAKNKKDAIVKNAKERASSTVNDIKQHVKDTVSKTPFGKFKKKKKNSSTAETIFDEIDDI